MAEYTITYSDKVAGFPSFYSFIPDAMIGMNNYFYTFKGGNLYRHNTNENRNEFYGVTEDTKSTMKTVINQHPLENKLFKTINIEGDSPWDVTLETDIQNSGFVEADWFDKKEQSYFAFVRNSGDAPVGADELALRSLNGIGRSESVTTGVGTTTVDFGVSVNIGSIASVGDMLYFALPPYDTPQLAGQITSIDVNPMSAQNDLVIDTTITGALPVGIQDAYFLYVKNAVAESHGVLGHYCVVDMENDSTSKVELFALESEVMKSFP